MAVRVSCILLLASAVVASLVLSADKPTVRKQSAWIVAPEHTGDIKVQIGDVVQIESEHLPLIPMHLGKKFAATQEGRSLQRIGILPPEGEGSLHQSYFYKAVAEGRTTVTVVLRDAQGTQLQSWQYAVVVERGTT